MGRRTIVLALGGLLALSACEMSADLTVKHDGSGTFGFSFLMEEALASQIPGGDPFESFRSGLPSGMDWTVDEVTEGGMRGVRASFPFVSVADLQAKMAALDAAEGSAPGGFGENFRLEQTSGGWVMEGTGEAPSSSMGSGLGAPGLGAPRLGAPGLGAPGDVPPGFEQSFDPAALAALIDVSMRVTLPGKAVSTNATETIAAGDSTTFVWAIDLSSTSPMHMTASTQVSAASLPLVPVGVGALLVGAGIIAAARLRRPKDGPPEPVFEGFTPRARDDDELAV